MEMDFNSTKISEDYSKALASEGLLFGKQHGFKPATVLFAGTSVALKKMANGDKTIPRAIRFNRMNGDMVAAAKLEYIKNDDDPDSPASGQWNYTWTTNPDDIADANVMTFGTAEDRSSDLLLCYVYESQKRFGMEFKDEITLVFMMNLMIEMLVDFVKQNTKDGDPCTLTLTDVFRITGAVEDGEIVIAIVPDGAMKVLVKNDAAIQE